MEYDDTLEYIPSVTVVYMYKLQTISGHFT
jgi:hypothetical protein